ncbi:hypothetical protein PHMEG_00017091 [Phytophthora megakarya]|uniref:Uncharacterized protein n=1 Tax=Phytophthora megakarya TaxID=4795 RepID=A0A225VX49_9STRA|nr:hypothetical protein PHMEG_00017091 [Phytophthora megakarya]
MVRTSTDRHEADLDQDPDLEEKPRIPLMAAPAATLGLDENLDPYTTDKKTTKSKSNLSTKPVAATRSSTRKKIKTARTKLKAPDSESEDVNKPRSTIAKDMIEQAYYRKILSETLLHDPVLAIIQVRQIGDLTGPISKPNTSTDRLNAVKILLDLLQEAGLIAGEFDPGPSGAKYLRSRMNRPDQRPAGPSRTPEKPERQEERLIPAGRTTPRRIRPDLATGWTNTSRWR